MEDYNKIRRARELLRIAGEMRSSSSAAYSAATTTPWQSKAADKYNLAFDKFTGDNARLATQMEHIAYQLLKKDEQ